MDRVQIGKNIDVIRKARKMSVTDLAREVGCSYLTTHRNILNGPSYVDFILKYSEALGCDPGDLFKGSVDPKAYELTDDLTSIYPYNLIFAIFQDMEILYDVYIPAFYEVFADELTIRERIVLENLYKYLMKLGDVGEQFDVTKERIRQIEKHAFRKLKHPINSNKYILGKRAADKIQDLQNQLELLKAENDILRREITFRPDEDVNEKIASIVQEQNVLSTPIIDLDFSVRTYNCLLRAGIKTLGDIRNRTIVDLMNIRNLGRKSLEEILATANSYGIKIEEGY